MELGTGVTCFVAQLEARFRQCDFGVPPVFRNANVQKLQTDRLKKLAAGNETTEMGKQILPWMQLHPRSAEGPAILGKLVKISRYGMRDIATSRQAFILLHKHSHNGSEAIRTNYFLESLTLKQKARRCYAGLFS